MAWLDSLRAAFSADAPAADLTPLFAAVRPLDALRQQLADRRLSAQIAHVGEAWLTLADLAALALPLWLGDSLVMLAQSLREAESAAHPTRPDALSAASQALAVAALRPIDRIVSEASAASADPNRPSSVTGTILAGPDGDVAVAPLPPLPPVGYLNGLLLAADRLHGAAGVMAGEADALLASGNPPPSLRAAVQHVKGDLAGAGTRLDLLRPRVATPPTGALAADAGTALASDLWRVFNIAFVSGQRLADPRLLPGYVAGTARPKLASAPPPPRPAPPPAQAAPPSQARRQTFAPPPPHPAPVRSRPEPARALPEIETTPAAPRERSLLHDAEPLGPIHSDPEAAALPAIGAADAPLKPASQPRSRRLPDIAPGGRATGNAAPSERHGDAEALELPQIGEGLSS